MAYLLVVDDEESLRNILQSELEQEGFVVDTACNGLEALEKARINPPDLIISDIMMPVMNGFDLQKKLSEDTDLRLIPLIFLSVLADKERLNEAKMLGADDYLTKPFEFPDLLIAIKAKLKKAVDRQSILNTKLDEIRKSILYSLPHEFRNPLSTLNGFISLLLDKEFEKSQEEEDEFLNYVKSSGERLNNLVTNFMKLAELEILATNRDQVKKLRKNRNFNWGLVVINFINDYTQKTNFNIDYKLVGEEYPTSLDLEAIQNILNELISNAKKFSKPDNQTAELYATANHKNLEIKIQDFGVGMEKDAISRITETFYQHNRKLNEQQGGGLGLTIVNKIVSIYGGKMTIESEMNKGTTIVINIPLYDYPN